MTMLWFLLPILFGLVLAEIRNRRHLHRLAPDRPQPEHPGLRLLPDILVLVALTLVLFALRPSHSTTVDKAQGPAIALVVDVSSSMGVTDRQPTRLDRAIQELLALIDNLPDARFALIPYAGEAVLQVPLTGDRDGLKFFINNLHTGLIDSLGSAPEEAVTLAQKSLSGIDGDRLIILISDGERTIAEQPPLLSDSIPVYCILTGTTTGGQVGNNRAAISRADPERLSVISHQTGGSMLSESPGSPAVFNLPLANRVPEETEHPPTHIYLAVALCLLLLRWAPVAVSTNRILSASLLLLVLILPGCESRDTTSPRRLFKNGLQAAMNKDYDSALAAFASAAKTLDGQQRGTALYNRATLLLISGQSEKAIALFEQALLLIPGDKSIRDNLLLALEQNKASSNDGKSKSKNEEYGAGEEMSPQQALRLVNSVQLDPATPPTEATFRQPTVLKEW